MKCTNRRGELWRITKSFNRQGAKEQFRPVGHFLHPYHRPSNQPTHVARFQRRLPKNPSSLSRPSQPRSKNQPRQLDPRTKAVPRKLVASPGPNPQPTQLDLGRKTSTTRNHPRQKCPH